MYRVVCTICRTSFHHDEAPHRSKFTGERECPVCKKNKQKPLYTTEIKAMSDVNAIQDIKALAIPKYHCQCSRCGTIFAAKEPLCYQCHLKNKSESQAVWLVLPKRLVSADESGNPADASLAALVTPKSEWISRASHGFNSSDNAIVECLRTDGDIGTIVTYLSENRLGYIDASMEVFLANFKPKPASFEPTELVATADDVAFESVWRGTTRHRLDITTTIVSVSEHYVEFLDELSAGAHRLQSTDIDYFLNTHKLVKRASTPAIAIKCGDKWVSVESETHIVEVTALTMFGGHLTEVAYIPVNGGYERSIYTGSFLKNFTPLTNE